MAHLPRRTPLPVVSDAFTLVEMMVSMGVLVLIMILISQLFNSATAITSMGNTRMDADSQARAVFDRMATDFAQIVKRTDIDYFLKDNVNTQSGNDQLAFFSQVPGYFTGATTQAPVSLVAYRLNADSATTNPYYNQLQRYGCGLAWNGTAAGQSMIFSGTSTSSGNNTVATYWPNAVSMTNADSSYYESIGPQVFRMEYYYVLKGQTSSAGTQFSSQLSDVPWEMRPDTANVNAPAASYHTSVNGLQDVAAITVVIAVADPRSRGLVTRAQLTNLASQMKDFPHTTTSGTNSANPGDLDNQWNSVITSPTNGVSKLAASSLRVYRRTFHLTSIWPSTSY